MEDSKITKEFGARLKALIKKAGMSQNKLAKESCATPCAISRYVKGERIPRYVTLMKMRDALGCSWEDLLGK